jgi:sialate O-acetylesterase
MNRLLQTLSVGALMLTISQVTSLAETLSLPQFFSDHMVLQREVPSVVWGNAAPNTEVKVSFKGNSGKVTSDEQGNWRTAVVTGAADAKGAELVITSGEEKIVINDVLVGEVWLASGQSNMVWTVDRAEQYAEEIAKADFPEMRFFNAPTVTAVEPQDDIEGKWTSANSETVGGYSAVAYFFAKKLHGELNIPVGVIKTAWGGKPVETFTSREALSTLPGTKKLVDAVLLADSDYDPEKAQSFYEKRLASWKTASADWKEKPEEQRGRAPRKPVSPKRPLDTEGKPGVLFNSMIHPFVGYTIRGAIWYQGEGNAKEGAVPYDKTLPLMINDWRTRWDDEFSFYYVQLANFRLPTTEPGDDDPWPLLQNRMRLVLDTTPKTGMAIINDVGEADDIHPWNKHDVGDRLALWALAKDYGKDLVAHSGPLYRAIKFRDKEARVFFDQVGNGLGVRGGGKLKRFEIAGEDKVWHWANARIEGGDSVVVSSKTVEAPVAVRYAWASNPEGANLINSEGLPASVFRTDD